MAGLPPFILFAFSSFISVFQKMQSRTKWILTLTAFLLAWILSIVLVIIIRPDFALSQWEPRSVAATGLVLTMDPASSTLAIAFLTHGLVVTFAYGMRLEEAKAEDFSSLCLMAAIGLLTLLSENLITLSITWALWEAAILILFARKDVSHLVSHLKIRSSLIRFATVPITLAIAVFLAHGGAGSESFPSQIAFLLGLTVALGRLDSIVSAEASNPDGSIARSGEIWIRGLTIVSGFVLLRLIFRHGYSIESMPLLRAIGPVLAFTGILWMVLFEGRGSRITKQSLALLGIGFTFELFSGGSAGESLIIFASLLIFLYSSMTFTTTSHLWRFVSPFVVSLIVLGMPGSIGGGLLNRILEVLAEGNGAYIAGGTIFCLLIVSYTINIPTAKALREADSIRPSSSYEAVIGAAILFTSGMIMGLIRGTTVSPQGVVTFLAMTAFLGVLLYLLVAKGLRLTVDVPINEREAQIGDLQPIANLIITRTKLLIGSTARIFEGRGGLLWAYVIVQLILISLGIAG